MQAGLAKSQLPAGRSSAPPDASGTWVQPSPAQPWPWLLFLPAALTAPRPEPGTVPEHLPATRGCLNCSAPYQHVATPYTCSEPGIAAGRLQMIREAPEKQGPACWGAQVRLKHCLAIGQGRGPQGKVPVQSFFVHEGWHITLFFQGVQAC